MLFSYSLGKKKSSFCFSIVMVSSRVLRFPVVVRFYRHRIVIFRNNTGINIGVCVCSNMNCRTGSFGYETDFV